jgi:hypothetical protein
MQLTDLPTNDYFTDLDWGYLFPGGEYDTSYNGTYSVHDRSKVADITADRIVRVDCWFADSPEGYGSLDFTALVELDDGTWAACMAWADTTGWGCQDDVAWKWATTRDDAIRYGLDGAARTKLGLDLPDGAA